MFDQEVSDLAELAAAMEEATGLPWMAQSVSKALHELGFSRVRVTSRAREQRAAAVAAYRQLFQLYRFPMDYLVFMDEVSTVGETERRGVGSLHPPAPPPAAALPARAPTAGTAGMWPCASASRQP